VSKENCEHSSGPHQQHANASSLLSWEMKLANLRYFENDLDDLLIKLSS